MTLMYEVVNLGLGDSGKNSWIFQQMQMNYFPDATTMGTNLFNGSTVMPPSNVLDDMYTS